MNVEDALAPVLKDMMATGAPAPNVDFSSEGETHSWLATLTAPDGSSHGLFIDLSLPGEYVVAAAAHGAQEWVFDELQRTGATNWPPCPCIRETIRLTRQFLVEILCGPAPRKTQLSLKSGH